MFDGMMDESCQHGAEAGRHCEKCGGLAKWREHRESWQGATTAELQAKVAEQAATIERCRRLSLEATIVRQAETIERLREKLARVAGASASELLGFLEIRYQRGRSYANSRFETMSICINQHIEKAWDAALNPPQPQPCEYTSESMLQPPKEQQ